VTSLHSPQITGDAGAPRARGSGDDTRLRIVQVLDNLEIGGSELNAVRTSERLDPSQFDVQFFCFRPDGPLRERLDRAGIPVYKVPIRGVVSASAVREGLAFRRLLREQRIDVVHAHDPYSNTFAAPWARLARGPAIITSQRWWKNVHRPALRVANRIAYRFADRVLANSPAVAEQVIEHEGVPRARVCMVPNFVDRDAFEPMAPDRAGELQRDLGLDGNVVSIGIVANLYPVKNHAMLLRAVARLGPRWPTARVILVGDGGERSGLEEMARSMGIADQVRFAGRRAHVPGLQGLFDIAVLCSFEEGFPNTVVEAMAAGRPVVATRVGGIGDAVQDRSTGYLVPSDDDAALAGALEHLLGDRSERARMGQAGQLRARELYHVDVVMSALERLYQELGSRARQARLRS
jgi:L-malate glycosyltransferase